jgi:hypothetical protein
MTNNDNSDTFNVFDVLNIFDIFGDFDIIEAFDGVRKDKSRLIFGILLILIIINIIIEIS